ncbi:MAG: hypothetical protein ACYDD9_09250 [Acidithiobacillus sp.]
MTTRANFSSPTKEILAKRAGYMCSFPGCTVITTGPSTESPSGVSNSGMACHIYAAAPGGCARRVSTMRTKEQLEDVSNGIWMCYQHGKIIDTDEDAYTADMLFTWKKFAELRANLSNTLGRVVELTPGHLKEVALPEQTLQITSLGEENQIIGTAIRNSCLELIWGKMQARATRDTLIELIRNALSHGKATNAVINIRSTCIELIDNGNRFDSTTLISISGGRGGSTSLAALQKRHGATIILDSKYCSGKNLNRITLVRKPEDIPEATPCNISITLDRASAQTIHRQVQTMTDCDSIYVLLPEYLTCSDAIGFRNSNGQILNSGKRIILVGNELSEQVVKELQKLGHQVEIMNFDDQTPSAL